MCYVASEPRGRRDKNWITGDTIVERALGERWQEKKKKTVGGASRGRCDLLQGVCVSSIHAGVRECLRRGEGGTGDAGMNREIKNTSGLVN